eukprot:1196411-Prorocentrum_minimum.AAC.5
MPTFSLWLVSPQVLTSGGAAFDDEGRLLVPVANGTNASKLFRVSGPHMDFLEALMVYFVLRVLLCANNGKGALNTPDNNNRSTSFYGSSSVPITARVHSTPQMRATFM